MPSSPLSARRLRPGRHGTARPQSGAATIEYTIVVALAVIVLVAGPSVITEVLDALKQVYDAFSYALALTFPTPDTL